MGNFNLKMVSRGGKPDDNLTDFIETLRRTPSPGVINKLSDRIKRIPLPKRWPNAIEKPSMVFEIIDRIDDVVLLRITTPTPNQRGRWFDVCVIGVNPQTGEEIIRPSINLDPEADPPDPHFDENLMRKAFAETVDNCRNAVIREQRRISEQNRQREDEALWLERVYALKKRKSELIYELKNLNQEIKSTDKFVTDKRTQEITSQIQNIEIIFKYGRMSL